MNEKQIIEAMETRRGKLGMSLEALAQKAGVARPGVGRFLGRQSKIEGGKPVTVNIPTLLKLAKALDMEVFVK